MILSLFFIKGREIWSGKVGEDGTIRGTSKTMKGMHEPLEMKFSEGNKWESENKDGENMPNREYKIDGLNSTDGVLSGSGSNGKVDWKIGGNIYPGNKVRMTFTLKDGQETTFAGTYDAEKKIIKGVESEEGFTSKFELKVQNWI